MSSARPPLFYGWVIVAASFVLMMLCSGLGIYALSVYLHAFVASGHFSMEQVSLASGLFSASGGLVSEQRELWAAVCGDWGLSLLGAVVLWDAARPRDSQMA